ncbi:MAG: sugar phosphate isomerase [Lentisphaerae bacterium]|nr:sugar phosphate isomerase [Lentisphaerota bacterium]
MSYIDDARDFELNEKPFHLGFLPTEQSNPLTRNLDIEFRKSVTDGIRNLQQVDRNTLAMAEKIFPSPEFASLCDCIYRTLRNGNTVVFSGCGATGRLSILLETMWRESCPEYAGLVKSIMTGGDFALVKSVESFEDHAVFGARQVQDLGMRPDDLLVAITEGGETSSVLGTVAGFTAAGGKAFLLFNNPAKLLKEHLERSRKAIENPRVTVLDLSCGPMAIAGSTRMQATTCEQLIASAALETAARKLYGSGDAPDFVSGFRDLLDALESDVTVKKMAAEITLEEDTYKSGGKVTYFADDYMLDLFTDTTERSPTFMLPPFRKTDDTVSPEPWALVKNPLYSTADTFRKVLGNRAFRCLEWKTADYLAMSAPEKIRDNPPLISAAELLKFPIGNEPLPSRCASGKDAAVLFTYGSAPEKLQNAFASHAAPFAIRSTFDAALPQVMPTGIRLFEHLAVKLQWNNISTGTMVKLGRVSGNWMSFVAISNKKLIDRAIRLVSELGNIDYHTACVELFRSRSENPGEPAVRCTLDRLGVKRGNQ